MFRKPIVFVIGAGASKEVGVPTGAELTSVIANMLNIRFQDGHQAPITGDKEILAALRHHAVTEHEEVHSYLRAAWRISEGMPLSKSIDSFMDNHKEDEMIQLCGKLAIVKSITEAEKRTPLYIDPRNSQENQLVDLAKIQNTWFIKFFKLLNEGVEKGKMDSIFDNVFIVNFNYDRCVEHFLAVALRAYYGLNDQQTTALMKRLNIVHPYGAVAQLPWQIANGVLFGAEAGHPANLFARSKNIRTYTERVEEATTLDQIHNWVFNAATIVFLGFAYHDQNMQLLTPNMATANAVYVFGTALGMSGADCGQVRIDIEKMLPSSRAVMENKIQIDPLACGMLFDQYSRTLGSL